MDTIQDISKGIITFAAKYHLNLNPAQNIKRILEETPNLMIGWLDEQILWANRPKELRISEYIEQRLEARSLKDQIMSVMGQSSNDEL